MSWPRCKGGFLATFDLKGNVETCTLRTDVSVTNSYGVSPSGQGSAWSYGFTCRANAIISFDARGNTGVCTSGRNQGVNNANCAINTVINTAANGTVTCR